MDCWFQKLTLWQLVWAWLRHFGGITRIFVETASPGAAMTARLLSLKIQHVSVELGTPTKRGTLRYAVEANLNRMARMLDADLSSYIERLPAQDRPYQEEWRRILRAHFLAHAMPCVRFLCFVDNHYAVQEGTAGNGPEGQVGVFVRCRFLPDLIARGFRGRSGRKLAVQASASLAGRLGNFPLPGIIVFGFLQALKASMARRLTRNVDAGAVTDGVVLEQYNRHVVTQYPEGGHLFWHQGSQIPHRQVVLYFNRLTDPISADAVKTVEDLGFGWADGKDALRHLSHPFSAALRRLFSMPGLFPRRLRAFDFWVWEMTFFLGLYVLAYRQFARELNVKVLHQHHEELPSALALALAVRMEGGAFFWNRWSSHAFPVARGGCGFADVVFSPGPLEDGIYNVTGYRYRYLLQAGRIWVPARTADDKTNAVELRAALPKNVDFVMTVFDSSYGANTHHAEESVVRFYEAVFAAMNDNPNWGILLKPKSDATSAILETPALKTGFEALKEEGRLHILDRYISIDVAARAGDVTLCYSLNSAGIFSAATVGARTVFCDLPRVLCHPFYYSGALNRICFTDPETMMAEIATLSSDPESPVGDMSPWMDLIVKFRDDAGNDRVGAVFGDYLRARTAGGDHAEALKASVDTYAAKWGEDAVSSNTYVQWHAGNSYWYRSAQETGLIETSRVADSN